MKEFFFLVFGVFGLAGCYQPYQFGSGTDCGSMPSYDAIAGHVALQCQEYRKLEADTALRNEAAQLLKAYRLCLAKYDGDPAKAKENCAVYTQALHEIEIKGLSSK